MDSEHAQFSSSQPESGVPNQQDAADTAPGQNAQPEQSAQAEPSQTEAASANRHRRRRPSRGGSRHNRSSAAEQTDETAESADDLPEATAQNEAPQETEQIQEPASFTRDNPPTGPSQRTEVPGESDAEATGDLESTASVSAPWQPAAEEAPSTMPEERVWGFQRWREQPPTDWNPFIPQSPAAQSQTQSAPQPLSAPEPEQREMMGDLAMGAAPAVETSLESNLERMAPTPTQQATQEATTAPGSFQSMGEARYEPMRAPLSGVEVRPPRRYRFDRPSPTTRETPRAPAQPSELSAAPTSPETPATHPSTHKESAASPQRKEPAETLPAKKEPGAPSSADTRLGMVMERELTETPEIEDEVVAAEDLARATQAALEEEVAEALESLTTSAEQATSARSGRRRRRRSSSSAATPTSTNRLETPEKAQPSLPVPAAPATTPAVRYTPPEPPAPYPTSAPTSAPQAYQVANGLQQIGQPQSPFAGPEPSSARGFGPVPRGVATPAERGVRMPRPERTVETGNISANQLALIFTQAVQQQTDRLLMELRRNQGTPSMTVNFPPMPSNERIGVFVDVANLLYSARNMRIAIDFGRLLDFLRGNRRLVRAHAYCPTSPDPRAEQMFLDAVKGLGYRITTKNYKTFSSGAKKADLDLDLCMDIVRMVDAGAVDCISLVSGDSDFLPLLEYCSDHGVRVEVAAFDEATASILRQSCDLFINLSLVEEIRA